jgi:hypothetical protein
MPHHISEHELLGWLKANYPQSYPNTQNIQVSNTPIKIVVPNFCQTLFENPSIAEAFLVKHLKAQTASSTPFCPQMVDPGMHPINIFTTAIHALN